MQNAAADWLMTSLKPDPPIVALVQGATSLEMFLFSLPGAHFAATVALLGALAVLRRWKLQTVAGVDLRPSMRFVSSSINLDPTAPRGFRLLFTPYSSTVDPL